MRPPRIVRLPSNPRQRAVAVAAFRLGHRAGRAYAAERMRDELMDAIADLRATVRAEAEKLHDGLKIQSERLRAELVAARATADLLEAVQERADPSVVLH